MGLREKASSPVLGSINLRFILLLQKFPIMFAVWDLVGKRIK